uniref:Protein kinase domain-containing protein n=1 Tax=Timema cristinae TaxID=61476 RepID=A0A7R9CJX9_TIMCR|nr:unnamed protein product [Timema cristinae]
MAPGATLGPKNRLRLALCFHADQMEGLSKKDTIVTLALLSTFNIATLYKHQFAFLPAWPPTGCLLKLLARGRRSAFTSSFHDSSTSSYWDRITEPPSSTVLHYTSVVWRSPRKNWLGKKCLTDSLADTFGGSTRRRSPVPWGRRLPSSTKPKEGPSKRKIARVGTVPYMSPEAIDDLPFDHTTTLWSLGVTIYEMLLGHRPFDGLTENKTLANISNADYEFPNKFHKEGEKLIRSLLQKLTCHIGSGNQYLKNTHLFIGQLWELPSPHLGQTSISRRSLRLLPCMLGAHGTASSFWGADAPIKAPLAHNGLNVSSKLKHAHKEYAASSLGPDGPVPAIDICHYWTTGSSHLPSAGEAGPFFHEWWNTHPHTLHAQECNLGTVYPVPTVSPVITGQLESPPVLATSLSVLLRILNKELEPPMNESILVTELRVGFDESVATSSGYSLNTLLKVSKLQRGMVYIVIHFHTYPLGEFPVLIHIKLNRAILTKTVTESQLRSFNDASNKGYVVVVYFLANTSSGDVQMHYIMAKSQIAPVKTILLTFLELCGAHLPPPMNLKIQAHFMESLTSTENKAVHSSCTHQVQKEAFEENVQSVKEEKTDCRLGHASLHYDVRHPILLPNTDKRVSERPSDCLAKLASERARVTLTIDWTVNDGDIGVQIRSGVRRLPGGKLISLPQIR